MVDTTASCILSFIIMKLVIAESLTKGNHHALFVQGL